MARSAEGRNRKVVDAPHNPPAHPVSLVPVRRLRTEPAGTPEELIRCFANRKGDAVRLDHPKIPGSSCLGEAMRHRELRPRLRSAFNSEAAAFAHKVRDPDPLTLHVFPELCVQ